MLDKMVDIMTGVFYAFLIVLLVCGGIATVVGTRVMWSLAF